MSTLHTAQHTTMRLVTTPWILYIFPLLGLIHAACANTSNSTEIRLLVLLPYKEGDLKLPFGAEMCGAAVLSAFRQIELDRLLPGYNLSADYVNSGCNAITGIGAAYDMLQSGHYDAVIGPQCSQVCRVVGRLAAYLNLPVFTGLCQDVEMSNKQEFSTMTRFLATFEMTGFAVCNVLRRYGWERVAIMAETQTDIIWLLTRNGLHYALNLCNITVAHSVLFPRSDVEAVLEETTKVSRIIILATHGATMREVMKLAAAKGLDQGDYIFICIHYYKQRKLFGDYNWQYGDEYDGVVRQVFPSVFFLSYYNRYSTQEYTEFIQEVKTGSARDFRYYYGMQEEVPYPAANLYEAVYLLAIAVNETLTAGGDISDGEALSQILWGRSFPSLTGGVALNANGDREQMYTIRHMQDVNTGIIEEIGIYFSANQSLKIFPATITWPGGATVPPLDTPPCGFEGELCIEDPNVRLLRVVLIFLGVLLTTIALSVIVVFGVYRRLKWEKELADMKWRIYYEDLSSNNDSKRLSMYTLSTLSLNSSNISTFGDHNRQRFTDTAFYKGLVVAVKKIPHIKSVDITNRTFLREMKSIYDLSHPNVAKIVGACLDSPTISLITEYCQKGCLQDILESGDIELDWTFKLSLMSDVIQGLTYLHASYCRCHGNLKSSNCVVDSRFVVKLTDFAPKAWHQKPQRQPKDMLWTAPELLLSISEASAVHTPEGDIYAFSIILQEILGREGPFHADDQTLSAEDIMKQVLAKTDPPFRPKTSDLDCPPEVIGLMTLCWADDPQKRPVLDFIKIKLKSFNSGRGRINIMDNLLSRMEHYASNLEGIVEERTGKYLEEKRRAEDLLHRLLPSSIAKELQTSGEVKPISYEAVSIYFSDIIDFTSLCSESSPIQVVTLLNDLYILFDSIIAKYDVYKVETIGDAYMTVSGLPRPNGSGHVTEIALMALKLLTSVRGFKVRHKPDTILQLRVGLHSGPCVAGVVGLTMPRYCLFGDTVNTASRMESHGEAMKIHISADTYKLLTLQGGFTMCYRGNIEIKGKGRVDTYWLEGGPAGKR